MELSVQEFLEAKFGHVKELTFNVIPNRESDEIRIGDLVTLLHEFKAVLKADQVAQAKNPRSGQYTVIDKGRGLIIGAFERPII